MLSFMPMPWEGSPLGAHARRPPQRQLGMEVDCRTCDAEGEDHRGAHAAMDLG